MGLLENDVEELGVKLCSWTCSPRGYLNSSSAHARTVSAAATPGRYVTRKDPETNAVYLSRQYHDQDKVRNAFTCGSFNWIGGGPPAEGGGQVHCKVRHGPHMYPCSLQVGLSMGTYLIRAWVTMPLPWPRPLWGRAFLLICWRGQWVARQ